MFKLLKKKKFLVSKKQKIMPKSIAFKKIKGYITNEKNFTFKVEYLTIPTMRVNSLRYPN